MTNRQEQLIQAEIARHVALAALADEPRHAQLRMEVAEALEAALVGAKGEADHV